MTIAEREDTGYIFGDRRVGGYWASAASIVAVI